ncbi:hypothetical protein C2869_01625 [Saccharobesus litoralis]|uniref:Uncharacterized protein n=1 Tax=Saccharobesus litoralis TaxID=2172099 RepID=A0A2S0VLY1_9ALTE|nr:hypothetical protein [Saccharobesus litoralis]AWB65221.1 hypothetical protein C2869_01625 [Saccharobesus litoralis]
MLAPVHDLLLDLQKLTKCPKVSLALEAELTDCLLIEFSHIDNGLEYLITLEIPQESFNDAELDQISDAFFAELDTQKQLHANEEGGCQ